MCFLDCHQPCLKIPYSPLNRPALLKKLKCFLNNLIFHHEKLPLFYPIFFFFFFFFLFHTLPFLFVKTSFLLKTSFPRKSFIPKKILPPSFKKKTQCLIKTLLIFPCIEKPKSFFFGNSFFSFSQNPLILIYFPFFHVFFYYLR